MWASRWDFRGQHGDRASLKFLQIYIKLYVKSLLSVTLAAMKLPSPIMNAPLAIPFDIRDNESTSTTFDVLGDSIPIVDGVPIITFRWLEELS